MAKGLRISSSLSLPVEVATEPMAIFARTGRGKTYTASVLAEEMLTAGIQITVVDPQGGWWGLRSSATGKGEGFPVVIFGGEHADVPLEPTGGKLAADLVVHEGISAIFDLSMFESRADEIRFMTDFADRLFRAKRRGTNLLHVFIDEASVFAPQAVRGDTAKMVGAVEAIAKRGRIKGLRCTCIDQRPASVNKNVINQAAGLFVMGLPSSQDRKAIKEWVTAKGEDEAKLSMLEELASLPVGSGWLWWPDRDIFQRVDIRKRKTFDSSATPEVGVVATEPKVLAKVDLEAVSKKMAATIERAKAEDPKELQRQIRDLRKQLQARPTEEKVKEVVQEIEVPVFKDGEVDRLEKLFLKLDDIVGGVAAAVSALGASVHTAREGFAAPAKQARGPSAHPGREVRGPVKADASARPSVPAPTRGRQRGGAAEPAPAAPPDDVSVSRPQQRILNALAFLEELGIFSAQKVQLALLADQSPKSSGYTNNLGTMRTDGLIDYPSPGMASLTDAGRALADAGHVPTTDEQLHEIVFSKVGRSKARILQALIEVYPDALAKEELAKLAEQSPTSSGYTNNLGTLRSLGLVDYPFPGYVCALPVLFIGEGV